MVAYFAQPEAGIGSIIRPNSGDDVTTARLPGRYRSRNTILSRASNITVRASAVDDVIGVKPNPLRRSDNDVTSPGYVVW
ncbi:hypothetical protein FRC12_008142 [Ceratobasidium sp. 428]|nr:hypothetical protein FRC12_008142 [Ceratobasidium sp. 428]